MAVVINHCLCISHALTACSLVKRFVVSKSAVVPTALPAYTTLAIASSLGISAITTKSFLQMSSNIRFKFHHWPQRQHLRPLFLRTTTGSVSTDSHHTRAPITKSWDTRRAYLLSHYPRWLFWYPHRKRSRIRSGLQLPANESNPPILDYIATLTVLCKVTSAELGYEQTVAGLNFYGLPQTTRS